MTNLFTKSLRGVAVAASLTGTLAALSVPASAQETLKIGKAFAGSFAYALIDLGVQQGIFKKHGLTVDVSSFEGGAKLQQAIAADAVDGGLSGGTDMVLTAKGAPMKAVAVMMVGVEQVAIVAPDSKFKSIADLKGSRWPAPSKASMPAWLPTAVAIKQGWGVDGISIVGGPPPAQAIALIKRGELDAMTMDPTTALSLQAKGEMRILFDFGDQIPSFVQYAIFVSDKAMKEKPKAVSALVAGWLETIAFAQANKAATVKSLTATLGVEERFVAETYDRVIKRYSKDGKFDAATIEAMRVAFTTAGFVEGNPDMKTLYTEQFLPK